MHDADEHLQERLVDDGDSPLGVWGGGVMGGGG